MEITQVKCLMRVVVAGLLIAAGVAFLACGAQADGIEYTYDASNRLIKTEVVRGSHSAVTEYDYDAAGNRVETRVTLISTGPDLLTAAFEFGLTSCASCAADADGDHDVDGKDIQLLFR